MYGEVKEIRRDGCRIEVLGRKGGFTCREDENVLAAMIASGQSLLPVGCRNGGCGVCRVKVLAGRFAAGPMSRAMVTAADQASGAGLSCRLYPLSDMTIVPMPLRRGAGSWPGLPA
ncbi:2Fe-2S iron-sulfur cluster-binding protein [Sphingobium sp. DC-2]|uniref:2Fe-2S iron-sulfur cluster-binding protein n=1 Tax=Sphingobium sp. DC-2 TaxID=1303256 RepID=UPI00068D1B48|nr:2Fe-2S iron-sulfur cluster-binding protein [Sphingobium sp. DC-2]